ncbi:molybdenum cofactor guanylyltransferase MobA [Neisseria wadsworthii]|uniref:Molybdenum cofactor guanylyltransferase n=1 Tax=Neisseria wadsworthii 9715 TaxID=1030841 RepID=G4CQT7_9NEIS|nr:molybdenum cofactor guanylyltransferase MobA [Neisseria wadsworthii]EGZ46083.1 molybdopterin-guanine dinucleotide biosynthesis protein A [Neisseria wadsworthii 9715]QMT35177.1 molybdenum cofactor guanylyltransferase [Neisseria wadsworthii]
MALNALILAGGQGSRMGGCDKGLAMYEGAAFIDHIIRRLNVPCAQVAVSANRNQAEYAKRVPLVFGDLPAYQNCGPLAALASAAETVLADVDWLLVVPCDTLHLPQDLCGRLMAAAKQNPGCRAFYAATETHRHHGVMLVHTDLLGSVAAYLDAGGRSIRGWLREHRARAVYFPNEAEFRNYNTLQDMENPHA